MKLLTPVASAFSAAGREATFSAAGRDVSARSGHSSVLIQGVILLVSVVLVLPLATG
jgi:hypothetical protein